MAEERVQRRLAAILAADVVGYSRLMGEDETGTLAALKELRASVIDPTIAEYQGRIVKLMGDGALVEFASVVDAVECAVSIQRDMVERTAGVPESNAIAFRIGVNIGDVIIDGDDIYGDGVNVAARLEGEAEPGGVCISDDAYRQVSGKIEHVFEDLGERALKNIAEPVRAYQVLLSGAPAAASGAAEPSDKPAIAVLPFDNLSGDPEQEYFSDGITEDIITSLSRIRQFFVIARNTTFTYRGQAVDVQDVARELGVRYVLEGSIRRAGDRIRVTAQLIDGETGNHIWAERYDRDLEDIFALQDELTTTVVGAIEPELSRAEQARARRKSSDNLDAWDFYQRGVWHCWRNSKEDLAEAQRLFQRAVELDSEFCLAYAYLAFTIWRAVIFRFVEEPKDAMVKALEAAKQAIAIDISDAHAHWAMGVIHMHRREHGLAKEELERAIEINPSFASAYQWLGWTLAYDRQPEEGIRKVQEAQRLSPNDPSVWGMILIQAQANLNMKEFAKAERQARHAKRLADTLPINCALLASMGHTGNAEDRELVLQDLFKIEPKFTAQRIAEVFPFGHQEDVDIWVEGLRLAGVPDANEQEDGNQSLADKPSIAVLPFDNMSGDSEHENFSDGLAEDIITALSKIGQMRVIARHSTFAYKGQALDLRRIAEELGVRYVLEGSVRRGGDRLRITAQLINATDGSHLWAERYDRSVDDLFDIQDEITKEIVTSLRVKLTDGEAARVWARGTNNIEAWQCGVRAMELFMRFTATDYLEARALAEKATQLDSEYAHAWATLGFTYWWDGRLGYTGDSDSKFARAAELAERSMVIDDTAAWGIDLSAMVAAPLGRHDEGVDIARRGLKLHPGNADVRGFLAYALMHAGIYREAEEHIRAAMSLNPFSPYWYRNGLARILIYLGEFDEALSLVDDLLGTAPANFGAWMHRAYMMEQRGREADARDAIHEVLRYSPNMRVRYVAGYLSINDAATTERFIESVRQAGLPE
jgi:adenylate cyclase